MKHSLVVLVFAVFLSGCSSVTPKTHYYVLSQDLGDFPAVNNNNPAIYLQSISLADYLNQPALLMMTEEQRVQLASYHFWAENLDKAIAKVMTHDLEVACECQVLNQSLNDDVPAMSVPLSIHVDQFAALDNGLVILSGRFRLGSSGEQKIHRFRFQQSMNGKGYQSAVVAQRHLLTLLANNIMTLLK